MNSIGLTQQRKTILFDMDGTLIDNFIMMKESLSTTMQFFGYPAITDEVFATLLGMGEQLAIRKLGVPSDQIKDIIFHRRGIMKDMAPEVKLFNGVTGLIHCLTGLGCTVGIVTGSTRDWIEIIPAARQIVSKVELLVTADDTDELKPHPAPILFALNKLGSPPQEAVYIGDGPHDIEAANRAGCLSFLASWNHHDIHQEFRFQPDYIVKSVVELEKLLVGDSANS